MATKKQATVRGPRPPRVSAAQKEALKDFLRQHPDLAKGYSRTPEAKRKANELWNEVAAILNAYGDSTSKSGVAWKKYYNDFKCKLKAKTTQLKRHQGGTGGGPPLKTSFSDTEEGILEVLGHTFGEGAPGIQIDPFPQYQDEDVAMDEECLDDSDDENHLPSNHRQTISPFSGDAGNMHDVDEPQPSTSQSYPLTDTNRRTPTPTTPAPQTSTPSLPQRALRTDAVPVRTNRPRARARPGASSRTTSGRCLTQLEESRRVLSKIEADRVAAERTHADALMGIRQEVARLHNVVEAYSTESLHFQRQRADAAERLATAAERRADATERIAIAAERRAAAAESRSNIETKRFENEERGVENFDPNQYSAMMAPR